MKLSSVGGEGRHRLAWVVLALTMASAAALLLWEGRGLTFFADEWWFGFGDRTGLAPSELLSPDNGHLAVVPILITKASLELFGAATSLPLRLVAVATHLTIALLFFSLLRRAIGDWAALAPTALILFLGSSSDLLVGSHALPMQIAIATGLAAWTALSSRTLLWDAAAAVLLVVGIGSNGLALPFVAGAAAIVLLAPGPNRGRLWVPALPLLVYLAWRLAYGGGSDEFALANIAGLPAFAFDSLGAELAAVTGLFTEPGVQQQSFNPVPGESLAGAVVVGILALGTVGRRRLPRATIPAVVALLALWLLTGVVAGPARQPESARYLYPGAILVLLIAAWAIAGSPLRRRGSLVLIGICAVGFLPNLREIHYSAAFFREQSNQDRAVLAAADLLPAATSGAMQVEIPAEESASVVADMRFPLGAYRRSKGRFGSPAYDLAHLEGADIASREVADRLLARVLPIALRPASERPGVLPDRIGRNLRGARPPEPRGCLRFEPRAPEATLIVTMPPGGLWIRPQAGPAVSVSLRRFGDAFAVVAGAVLGPRPSVLWWAPGPLSRGWEARIIAQQPTLVCGVRQRGARSTNDPVRRPHATRSSRPAMSRP